MSITQSRPLDLSQHWYQSEVPSIVTGLQTSKVITSSTASKAWELIEEGAYQQALSLALGEAF